MRDPLAVEVESIWREKRRAIEARARHDDVVAGGQGHSRESVEASARACAWAALGLLACVVIALVLA